MTQAGHNHYCHYIEKDCTEIGSAKSGQGLFFAYPSKPESSADAIQGAIARIIEDKTLKIPAVDWADLPIEGNIILCEICKAIRNSNCVVVNTTYVNFNVLFEYGFAIGSGRAIWPLVEEGVSKDELISKNIKSITTIGYSVFSNSDHIYKKMVKKRPWDRSPHFVLPLSLGDQPLREATGFLYIKSAHNNEPSLRISEALSSLPVELVVDDPYEVPFHHIAWYLAKIGKAYAIVIHLGNERMLGAQLHWAKCALVAGMALALGRRLLVLGEAISFEPIDYHDLLRSYKNAQQAEETVKIFVSKIVPELTRYREYMAADIGITEGTKGGLLASADLGDCVAENEQVALQGYFVETHEFTSALQSKCTVFVGRKGSGKTANFYMIGNRLLENGHEFVCMIKPKEYELNELVQFVKNELDLAKTGYLLESLWKFMLYSEALVTAREKIVGSGIPLLTPSEISIANYFGTGDIGADRSFTSRLVRTVRRLCEIPHSSPDTKVAISEALHVKEIGHMHEMLCEYIDTKNIEHFAILIDGLDANWRLGENHEIMSDTLLALIGAAGDIWRDCSKHIGGSRYWKGTTIAIFIRSDVFATTLERARDPDKLQFEALCWPTVDSLINLIVKRIMASSGRNGDVLNWTEILEPGFSSEEMKTILNNNVLPRPRDIIYYFQRVIYYSHLRGTKYITKRDFQSALDEYSQWVLLSLSAEAQPYIPNMLDLLLEFDHKKAVLSMPEINEVLTTAGVNERDLTKAFNFLVDINFLGYGIDAHNYGFPSSPTQEIIMERRFLRHAKGNYMRGQFKIHNAFHSVLSIQ